MKKCSPAQHRLLVLVLLHVSSAIDAVQYHYLREGSETVSCGGHRCCTFVIMIRLPYVFSSQLNNFLSAAKAPPRVSNAPWETAKGGAMETVRGWTTAVCLFQMCSVAVDGGFIVLIFMFLCPLLYMLAPLALSLPPSLPPSLTSPLTSL